MMKSESEAALGQDTVPKYLRAYGPSYRPGRYSHRYHPIEDEQEQANGSRLIGARTLAVFSILVVFGTAVSNATTRWTAGAWRGAGEVFSDGQRSYRAAFQEETIQAASSRGTLELSSSNEYGEFDRRALVLYGLDMVVEPYKRTTIRVQRGQHAPVRGRFHWLLVEADENGVPLETAKAEIDAKGGAFATIELTNAGRTFALMVREISRDGSTLAMARAKVSCKHVRREIRDLTDVDREAYFSAMREFYSVSLEQGQEKYGEDFVNAKRVAAVHNAEDYCYHNGIHFLIAHSSFGLWVERSLQMINPAVSLVSWDFMLDAAHLGTRWTESEIFGPDMFGSALGKSEDQFQISDGWFKGITSPYDPFNVIQDPLVNTTRNPYGHIGAPYDYQDLPGVVRTHSFCGMEGEARFPECDTLLGCFSASDNLYDWSTCMETKVHASMHGTIGGGFNCNTDLEKFRLEHREYSRGLLTFTVEFILANKWPSNSLMDSFNECDKTCERGQEEPCGCTCTVDPFELTDDQVYDVMEGPMTKLAARFGGDAYINEDPSVRNSLGFMQDGRRLDNDANMLLLRLLMVIGCEPGAVGAMGTGASPMDPLFWVLHPMFEKALHILLLSPSYQDGFDLTWVDSECSNKQGGNFTDKLPFTERKLGQGDGQDFLTNEEIWAILSPSNAKLPYLYDNFNKWGDCTTWDPCPECVTKESRGMDFMPGDVSSHPVGVVQSAVFASTNLRRGDRRL